MKKLLFICLMAISSLFVFADGGKISCKVIGNKAVTVTTPIVDGNSGSVCVVLKLTEKHDKAVTVIVNVLDNENNIVATDTYTFAVGVTGGSLVISNSNIKKGEKYKIRISNVSCQ